jgi:DHA1 family multidrug resistance protein-like MFS transporter
MPAPTIDSPAISAPLARTPSVRSKLTTMSDKETSRKSKEDHQDVSNDAIPDVEKGVGTGSAGQLADRFFVEFDGPNDPENPKNWTPKRRWGITISMGLMVFTVTFASSIFSVNLDVIVEKFDVTLVTATLGVALFVLVC